MNFAKIAFGALLLAVGALLLAVPLGFAPPDTPIFLLRYWPVLLIAFGLAFLASVIKNRFLGCVAVLLILGGTALGIFWMKQHHRPGKAPRGVSSLDLGGARVSSLTVRVRTFAGRLEVGAASGRSRALSIGVSGLPGDSAVGYRFDVSGKKAVLEWPQVQGGFGIPPPGAAVVVRVPEALPLTLNWRGRLASMRADLARLRITRLDAHEIASSILVELGDARPEEIRIGGFASSVTIRIPADCPIRLVSRSPLVLRNLPSDFVEQAKGRGKDRVDVAEGRGRPVKIIVDGPLIRVTIERSPSTKALVKEGSEWQEAEGTASRSHSPWS